MFNYNKNIPIKYKKVKPYPYKASSLEFTKFGLKDTYKTTLDYIDRY